MIYSSIKIATTGLDKQVDHILRISCVEFEVNENVKPYQSRIERVYDSLINPQCDFEILEDHHNFTKEDILKEGRTIFEVAPIVKSYIENRNIVGFNIDGFEVPFIWQYFLRHNITIDLTNTCIYDTYMMDSVLVPRTFRDIYKRYIGKELNEDFTKDTLDVAQTSIDLFAIEYIRCREQELLEQVGLPIVSPERLVIRLNGDLVFANGKYQYKKVVDICKSDPDYIKWIWKVGSSLTKKSIAEEYNTIIRNKANV